MTLTPSSCVRRQTFCFTTSHFSLPPTMVSQPRVQNNVEIVKLLNRKVKTPASQPQTMESKTPRLEKYHYHKEIDNDLLIQEVKIRPAIYDRNMKEYNDPSFKKRLWEQIFEKMYQSVWNTLDESEKEIRGLEVIKRWNNLRSSFTRDLKTQNDPTHQKRRKYVYFNKLLFLLDHSQHASLYNSEQGPNQDAEDSDPLVDFKVKQHFVKITDKDKRQQKMENYVDYSINKLKSELSTSLSALSTLTTPVSNDSDSPGPSTSKPLESCPDTNFALSLVPMLKLIPMEQKIDAHIEILSILKKFARKDTVDVSVVKFEREDGGISENSMSSSMLEYYESND